MERKDNMGDTRCKLCEPGEVENLKREQCISVKGDCSKCKYVQEASDNTNRIPDSIKTCENCAAATDKFESGCSFGKEKNTKGGCETFIPKIDDLVYKREFHVNIWNFHTIFRIVRMLTMKDGEDIEPLKLDKKTRVVFEYNPRISPSVTISLFTEKE